MGELWVGTSGFASPSIRDAFSADTAAPADLLAGYSKRFAAVELDSVFYRRPSDETVKGWIEATDDSFRFAVRVPREITHVDHLAVPVRATRFIDSIAQLHERLGCVLFTTPPTLECDVSRFVSVLDAIPENVRTAWEFRHPSWLCSEVLGMLAERRSGPVVVETNESGAASNLLPGGTLAERWEFPFVYVRFRRESYNYADLVVWGEILGDVIGEERDVYAFFRQSPLALSYATALSELLIEAKEATFTEPMHRAIQ